MTQPGDSGPAAMLTDAISRVALLEQQQSQLSSDVADLGGVITTATETVQRLESALAEVTGTATEEEAAAGEREAELVDWSRLDQTQARLEWQRLEQWLDQWLVPTYEIVLDELPPCWMHHPAMREELSWLRSAWAAAYRASGSGAAGGEWHMRWLPGAFDRIAQHAARSGCDTAGKHRHQLLSEDARTLTGRELATAAYWSTDGREADIAARVAPTDIAAE